MAKRIVQMHDKYKSTTNVYPKVTMGSLSPQVKAYIEGQGGGFPSIEITAEQQQSEGVYLLTSEQIATMEDNTFMYIKVPTLTKPILFFRGVDQLFDGVYLVGVTVVSNSNYSNLFVRYGLSVNKTNNLASLRDGSFGRYEITSITASEGVISSVSIKDYLTKNTSVLTVGGGSQLYQHNILLSHTNANYRIFVSIINDSATPMTEDDLISYLNDRNYVVKANGSFYDSGSHIVWGLYKYSSTQYNVCYQRMSDGSISTSWLVNKGFFTFTDNVETL